MKHTVVCHVCNGTGKTDLPDTLKETLSHVPRKGGIVACDLTPYMPGITSNAQNNRLEKLRAMGFVKRQKMGKFWRYSRV